MIKYIPAKWANTAPEVPSALKKIADEIKKLIADKK
jgi:hypothetical protein